MRVEEAFGVGNTSPVPPETNPTDNEIYNAYVSYCVEKFGSLNGHNSNISGILSNIQTGIQFCLTETALCECVTDNYIYEGAFIYTYHKTTKTGRSYGSDELSPLEYAEMRTRLFLNTFNLRKA